MSKQILEQVLEHILNKEEGKASDLLHQYFVDKGRSIYESLIQSDELAEDDVFETEIDDDQQSDFADDISAKQGEIESEEMFSEDEEDFSGDDEFAQDDEAEDEFANADDEFGSAEGEFEGEEKEELSAMQDAVLDVEDALDELKSLFAEFQSTEDSEEEAEGSEEEFGSDEDMGQEDEEVQTEESLEESADLIAVAKPTFGDNGQNAKSPVRANSGQAGMSASPVKMGGGAGEAGGKVGDAKDMGIAAGNRPNQKSAPVLRQVKAPAKPAQASGRSPIAGK
jgi:hypothetical protein